MEQCISLRKYINNRNSINSVKIHTFCKLMKEVSFAIDKFDDNTAPIKINLDNIKINLENGDIIFDSVVDFNNYDRTMVDIRTGVSAMTDRKASKDHRNISFALMFLGWYVNNDNAAIQSDLQVLENFDQYMEKVPVWLHDFFIGIFKKMDYKTSFSEYYNKKFIDKINFEISDASKALNLNKEEAGKFGKLIIKSLKGKEEEL